MTETSAASFVNRHQGLPLRQRRAGPCPAPRCASPRTARCCCAAPATWRATTTTPRRPPRPSTPRGGCTPATSASSTTAGFLRITDRKKDLFKTSGGKYVAPSIIESTFKGLCPYASQLVVYGADRNFVSALVTLDPDAIQGWAAQHGHGGRVLRRRSSPPTRAARWCRATSTSSTPDSTAGRRSRSSPSSSSDLTVEDGELTPSLKLKRKVVAEKYKDRLDAHYSG